MFALPSKHCMQVAKLPQAILSTTKKAQRRARAKAEKRAGVPDTGDKSGELASSSMDVDSDAKASTSDAAAKEAVVKNEEAVAAAATAAAAAAADEVCPFMMDNPARCGVFAPLAPSDFVMYNCG